MSKPAEQLEGMFLDGRWKVLSRVPRSPVSTGGWFSEGYIVEDRDGKRAFLKALDYSAALKLPDPAPALKALTESFLFERDVLNRCKTRRMDRVVAAIGDGTVRIGANDDVVQYLVFELADSDWRVFADSQHGFDVAWILRALHHIVTGVAQLHSDLIAHQDIKPSNALVFGGRLSKVADLGRASARGATPPHETFDVAGDKSYAPPELLYGYTDPNWHCRRLGCDVYLVGSMIVFCFCGSAVTPLLQTELLPEHRWKQWPGTYDEVLPYLRDAFDRVIDFIAPSVPESCRAAVISMVRQLCDPDPRLRGDRQGGSASTSQYRLDRFRTQLDLLASRAEIAFARGLSVKR